MVLKMRISNKELAEELHKPIIKKFEKRKAHSCFLDNICGADLADMQLISKFEKGFKISKFNNLVNLIKCLWSGWKWYRGVNEIPYYFPYSPVNRECSWKKTQTEKQRSPTKMIFRIAIL